MTLADDVDAIKAMVSGEASPDDVGRMVLMGIAKNSDGPAGRAARRLLGSCRRNHAPEPSHPEATSKSVPNASAVRRTGRLRAPAGSS